MALRATRQEAGPSLARSHDLQPAAPARRQKQRRPERAAPQSPQLPGLDDRIAAYQREINNQESRVAGQTNSLAPKIAEYERLILERDFMGRVLTSAVSSLETARIEARRKRLYLQRIVNPIAADAPILPRRTRSVLIVFMSLLLAYGAVRLVIAGLREHQQAG